MLIYIDKHLNACCAKKYFCFNPIKWKTMQHYILFTWFGMKLFYMFCQIIFSSKFLLTIFALVFLTKFLMDSRYMSDFVSNINKCFWAQCTLKAYRIWFIMWWQNMIIQSLLSSETRVTVIALKEIIFPFSNEIDIQCGYSVYFLKVSFQIVNSCKLIITFFAL